MQGCPYKKDIGENTVQQAKSVRNGGGLAENEAESDLDPEVPGECNY
jgi:hypothetical protein